MTELGNIEAGEGSVPIPEGIRNTQTGLDFSRATEQLHRTQTSDRRNNRIEVKKADTVKMDDIDSP